MYLYETHCHTQKVSACSRLTAEDIVELYIKNGYAGVFITDHFLNGNTRIHLDYPNAAYKEKITAFFDGYKEVKEAAGNRLQVFFGFEYSYRGSDILVYGWNEEQLKEQERILQMSMREFCEYCAEQNVLAIQAHPFRQAYYIDHIRLYPEVEGVEIINSARDERCNRLAEFYANEYKKIKTGGSDIHIKTQKILSGVAFDDKLQSERDFIDRLRQGQGTIIQKENVFFEP